jgi:hypothetical protein
MFAPGRQLPTDANRHGDLTFVFVRQRSLCAKVVNPRWQE